MIEGITILNEIPVYAPSTIQYALCVSFLVCMLFVGVVASTDDTDENFIACGVLGVMFIVSLISLVIVKPVLDCTKYEVTIDDEVKFTEFNNKYYIIKQKGLIYTIKEKE